MYIRTSLFVSFETYPIFNKKRKKSKRQTDNMRIEGIAHKTTFNYLIQDACQWLPQKRWKHDSERGHDAQDLGILLVQPMVISNESFMVFVGLEEIKLPWRQNFQSPNEKIWRKG